MVWMFHVRDTASNWPIPFEFGSLLIVFAMAGGGVCGSITMAIADNCARKGEAEESVRWVAIAISAWLTFIVLEAVEWVNMVYLVELGPRTPFGMTYLAITGAHLLGIIVCVGWFSFCLTNVRKHDLLASALYSHFLAIWWIVIVFVVYFPNMHPLADL